MKFVILAAGENRRYFPIFFNKPKCLYHLNGSIKLGQVIENAKQIVPEKDIIVVGGYKYKYIKAYLEKEYPEVEFRVNEKYMEPAIYSFRTAIENVDADVLFTFGDESISLKNIKRIAESNKKLSIMYHDTFYYYSLGIFKLRKDCLYILNDDKYLNFEELKEIYKFANNKTEYDGCFNINSGICIGYMMIDMVRRLGNIQKVEHPSTFKGDEIDFLHYDPKVEYINDLDSIYDTDEYKSSFVLKLYNKFFSNPVKRILYHFGIWK